MDEGYYNYYQNPTPTTTNRIKRKGFDAADDDFSDFSLSSPARKIQRLVDAGLPPIVEEYKHDAPIITCGHDSVPEEDLLPRNASAGGLRIEELPALPENNERAIVLFNPNANVNPFSLNPSNFLLSINPQLISGLKNQELWTTELGSWKLAKQQRGLTKDEDDSSSGNASLAVVPWVPSQNRPEVSPNIENIEMVDADEVFGRSDMDVEDNVGFPHSNAYDAAGGMMTLSENQKLHQWPQQHCFIPQPTNNLTTPMFGYQ